MRNKISGLQIRKSRFDSTRMTDLNHWSTQMALAPKAFEPAHRILFASKTSTVDYSKGNILESLFGLSKTKWIDDLSWGWAVKTQGTKGMTILENRTPETKTPGKYRQPITILVDMDLGAIGESWWPGSSDKSQVAIISNKVKEGSRGYLYTIKTYTENEDHYIKPAYLKPGVQWTRAFAMRGEAAESGGYTEHGTDIEYENNLVKLRKEYKVTDFAAQAVLEIVFRDEAGKIHTSWMDHYEASYHMAMNKELANSAVYSRLGDAPITDPDSGYPIVPGAGMEQQVEFGGNTESYTTLTAEVIEAFFDRMVYARIAPGDLGEVIGLSGYYGMKMFAKALDIWSGGKAIIRDSSDMQAKDPKGVHKNSLQAGYQYTSFALPNGGTFRLVYDPMKDDKSLHRDIDKLTGVPLESQKITILDVTGGSGESINPKDNIRLVRKNKVYGTTIVAGRVGPGGVSTGSNAKHSGDYYRVDISDSIGIEITDPTVTGALYKAVQE